MEIALEALHIAQSPTGRQITLRNPTNRTVLVALKVFSPAFNIVRWSLVQSYVIRVHDHSCFLARLCKLQ